MRKLIAIVLQFHRIVYNSLHCALPSSNSCNIYSDLFIPSAIHTQHQVIDLNLLPLEPHSHLSFHQEPQSFTSQYLYLLRLLYALELRNDSSPPPHPLHTVEKYENNDLTSVEYVYIYHTNSHKHTEKTNIQNKIKFPVGFHSNLFFSTPYIIFFAFLLLLLHLQLPHPRNAYMNFLIKMINCQLHNTNATTRRIPFTQKIIELSLKEKSMWSVVAKWGWEQEK